MSIGSTDTGCKGIYIQYYADKAGGILSYIARVT